MRRIFLLASAVLAFGACDSKDGPTKEKDTVSQADGQSADGQAGDGQAGDGQADGQDENEPQPWQHEGPILSGDPLELSGPLFVERTDDAMPEDLVLQGDAPRVLVVDFDGDGRDDIVTLGRTQGMLPRFLKNTTEPGSSEWSFEDVTEGTGVDKSMSIIVFADIDNDGDMDFFAGTSFRSAENSAYGFWENDGTGHFTYRGANGLKPNRQGTAYKEMAAATLADFNGDGILDLYIAMWNPGDKDGGLYLQHNDEFYAGLGDFGFEALPLPDQHNPLTSQFEPSFAGLSRRGYGLCPGDFNNDGKLDLFVNNYGAGRPAAGDPPHYWEWNLLWQNLGDFGFEDIAESAGVAATERGIGGVQEESPIVMNGTTYPGPIGGNGFGCDWGDFNNDGHLDLVVGQIAHPDYPQSDRLMLHVNQGGEDGGKRVFTEESAERGLKYFEDELHPVFVDINLDGRLDLAVARWRDSKWEVYLQNEAQNFDMQTYEASGVDLSRPTPAAWLDVDGDGDLDLYFANGDKGRLFENVAGTDLNHHYLAIHLEAAAPRDATGARVTLKSSVGPQMREVIGGTGHYNTQHSRTLYFGLGGDSGAEDVTIRWPNGDVQELGNVKANITLLVTQDGEITIK